MKKTVFLPFIGNGEQDIPVKNWVGIDDSMTWDTKKTAAEFGVGQAWFSDLNAIFYSNGSEWKPTSEIILKDITKGYIVPSLAAANAATYSQSGTTLTITSASHSMTSVLDGSDVYLAIGAVSVGVAPVAPIHGNWFTDFTYVDANTFTCIASNSQVGSGVVNTNLAETAVLELTHTLLGGMFGTILKSLEALVELSGTAVAGNKTMQLKFDGSTYHGPVFTSSALSYRSFGALRFISGSMQRYVNSVYSGLGGSAGVPLRLTKDTSTSKNHTVSLQVDTANQYISILAFRLIAK